MMIMQEETKDGSSNSNSEDDDKHLKENFRIGRRS